MNDPSHLAPVIPLHGQREATKMPRAVIDTKLTERKDLETLPPDNGEEGGYVELRRMSYKEFLQRRDMVSSLSFDGQGKDTKATMEMAQAVVTQFEFQTCIVDHNLLDANDKPLDFRSPKAFSQLDPRVGEEIATYIDEMNKWDRDSEGDDPLPVTED